MAVNIQIEAIAEFEEYDTVELFRQIWAQLTRIQEAARQSMYRTVATWERKPTFFVRKVVRDNAIEVHAGTDDKLWTILDLGAKPHTIRAKNVKNLKIGRGYQPKTRPGIISSRSGGSFDGGSSYFVKEVHHPGSEPRKWSQVIAMQINRRILNEISEVFLIWVSVSHRR